MKERLLSIYLLIRQHHQVLMLFFLLFLLSALSFGIGYRIRGEMSTTPIIIQKCSGI